MDRNGLKETYANHKIGNLRMNIYESSTDIPYHWHDEYEFLYVTEGECDCIVNGKNISVSAGQVILINAGELHTVNSGDEGRFFAVVFHPYVVFGTESGNYFNKQIRYNRIYDGNSLYGKRILSALEEIYNTFHNRYMGFELMLKGRITEIFGIIYREKLYAANEVKEQYTFDAFTEIIEYIHTRYEENITLDDVAEYSNFSKSYLIRLFRKNTGKTFCTYLNGYRIYKAAEMLENTDKNILEVSEACGFRNVAYFIKVFRNHTGFTPRKYRVR